MKPVRSLTNPSPDEERDRSRDFCRSIDEEKVDLEDGSDVELDGNDHLDLESEHNDDDLDLSHVSLRITIHYTPPTSLVFQTVS